MKTPAIRALANAGADLMKNMFDIYFFLPKFSTAGASAEPTPNAEADTAFTASYPLACRATGFEIPDVTVDTYDVEYHGVAIKRPATKVNMERVFSLTFREDAAFSLRQTLTKWHSMVVDPVTGGVANSMQYLGKVAVRSLAGAFTSPMWSAPDGGADGYTKSDKLGAISEKTNVAEWTFYGVWVTKVSGVKFATTDSAAPNELSADFAFLDVDFPFYGGNALNLGTNIEPSFDGAPEAIAKTAIA
jgi:hypothetical protein